MIKASELRQKYFNEESYNNSTFERLKILCENSIVVAAENNEDSVTILKNGNGEYLLIVADLTFRFLFVFSQHLQVQ